MCLYSREECMSVVGLQCTLLLQIHKQSVKRVLEFAVEWYTYWWLAQQIKFIVIVEILWVRHWVFLFEWSVVGIHVSVNIVAKCPETSRNQDTVPCPSQIYGLSRNYQRRHQKVCYCEHLPLILFILAFGRHKHQMISYLLLDVSRTITEHQC